MLHEADAKKKNGKPENTQIRRLIPCRFPVSAIRS